MITTTSNILPSELTIHPVSLNVCAHSHSFPGPPEYDIIQRVLRGVTWKCQLGMNLLLQDGKRNASVLIMNIDIQRYQT
jgi:hypothetical protein